MGNTLAAIAMAALNAKTTGDNTQLIQLIGTAILGVAVFFADEIKIWLKSKQQPPEPPAPPAAK